MDQLAPEYTLLYHQVNKAVETLQGVLEDLQQAQIKAETAYLDRTEPKQQ